MEGDQLLMDPQGQLRCEWPQAQELLIQRGQRTEPSRSFLPPAASPDWHGISPESLAGVTPCQPPRVSSCLAGTAAPARGHLGHSAFPPGEMGMALEAALPGVLCPGSCSGPGGAGAQGSPWPCRAPAAPWGFPAPGLPEESCWHCRGSCWPRHSGKCGLS